MSAADRLARWNEIVEDTYPPDENWEVDAALDLDGKRFGRSCFTHVRFALVQRDDVTEQYWISGHADLEAVQQYIRTDGSEFQPYSLFDLDTGAEFLAIATWSFPGVPQ